MLTPDKINHTSLPVRFFFTYGQVANKFWELKEISQKNMSRHGIIFIAAEPWDGSVWRRRHHVAWSLAREHRVLFIEPPVERLSKPASVKHQGRNLYSISVKKWFPDRFFRNKINISWINAELVRSELKKIAKEMEIKSPLLWIYFCAQQYDYFNLFNEKLIISDWHDMFTANFGWTSDEYERNNFVREKKIIKSADVIFGVSEKICEHLKEKHRKVYFMPHGVNNEIFDTKREADSSIEALKNIKGPKIGYLGAIQYKIDFELLSYVAWKCKDWNIVLAGRKAINNDVDNSAFKKLLEHDNAIYLGEIAKEQIPNFLKTLDICTLPFKKVKWTQYFSPLKVLEYLASGKSIVAMDRGIDYEYSKYICVAKTADEFIRITESLLKQKEDRSVVEERKRIAKNNSWDQRVNQMMEIIEKELLINKQDVQ
ncbi:MAG: glycosyltransferase [Patescibacteria group bacterium]